MKLLGLEEPFLRRYERAALRSAEANAVIGVTEEVPRNILRAVALGGILFFVVVMLMRGDGDLTAMLPILGLYAFAGLRLLPALILHDREGGKHTPQAEAVLRGEASLGW